MNFLNFILLSSFLCPIFTRNSFVNLKHENQISFEQQPQQQQKEKTQQQQQQYFEQFHLYDEVKRDFGVFSDNVDDDDAETDSIDAIFGNSDIAELNKDTTTV